jgi:hypothetical protein
MLEFCQTNVRILSQKLSDFDKKTIRFFTNIRQNSFIRMRENIGNIGQKAQLDFWQQ